MKEKTIKIGLLFAFFLCVVVALGFLLTERKTTEEDECVITQYADVTGNVANCYTITKGDKLIIIDGGWAENAPALRDIIASHGNHVDAWIISHTHSDHVGAFNVIYADPQGITIDTIYDNGTDYDFMMTAGEPFDSLEPLKTYHELTKDALNVVHLKRNEHLDICGLKVDVYNAFDDIMKERVGEQKDYQNNGSLCLKFTNKDESFLYTGDMKLDLNEYMMNTYGDQLNSSYVQLSHHGNWGLSADYYISMDAKAYFADIGPSYYQDFPIGELRQHILDSGKIYYDYGTAPNRISLK